MMSLSQIAEPAIYFAIFINKKNHVIKSNAKSGVPLAM